ncbi:MAG: DUF7577 domain-containing protein [Phycisphaeraceae bacterium]
MTYDPRSLPLPDLGLRCLDCGYALAHITAWQCPECGREVELEEHIPDGAFPPLIADGEEVRSSGELRQLMEAYRIPIVELRSPMHFVLGPLPPMLTRHDIGPPVAVPRELYFEAVDLIRRWRLDEELPPPPEPLTLTGPWRCEACGEENPETFEICWNCGEQATAAAVEPAPYDE